MDFWSLAKHQCYCEVNCVSHYSLELTISLLWIIDGPCMRVSTDIERQKQDIEKTKVGMAELSAPY
jgi:hypothetical protein